MPIPKPQYIEHYNPMNIEINIVDQNKSPVHTRVHSSTSDDVPNTDSSMSYQRYGEMLDNVQWSHETFLTVEKQFEFHLYAKEYVMAVDLAEAIQKKCVKEGDNVYLEAPRDIAKSYFNLGRAFKQYGSASLALLPLSESQRRYGILSTWGTPESVYFLIETTSAQGDCLRDLGRLSEAATAYEQAIHYGAKSHRADSDVDLRSARQRIAHNMVELATTYVQMGHYSDALIEYREALAVIQKLDERDMMAQILQQMGIVYTEVGQLGQAEAALVEAWNLNEDSGNRVRSADALTELGNLLNIQGGLEEAIEFYQQATSVYVELGFIPQEGAVRSNIADVLIQLGRFDEAQIELERSIECEQLQGHAAEQWKTWNIVRRLHKQTGNQVAELEAYTRSINSYSAYRQAGGTSQSAWSPICTLVLDAIQSKDARKAKNVLSELLARQDLTEPDRLCIRTLEQILLGNHSPEITDNIELNYLDVAELKLLLEFI